MNEIARTRIPTNDTELNGWLQNFVSVLTANAATVGLVPDDVIPITESSDRFEAALSDYKAKKSLMEGSIARKNTERTGTMTILRPLIGRICKHPGMTDQLRALLGLGRDDIVQAPIPIELLPPPDMYLETKVGSVIIHFGPNPQNERENGKPAGVKGVNIYRKKSGEADYQFVNFATSSPYVDTITGPAADYEYVARYRGSNPSELGATSPGETVAARGVLAA